MKTNYKSSSMNKFHKRLALVMGLGHLAAGYALGIAGPAVLSAQNVLGLSAAQVGLLGAGTLIGLFGSLFIGNLSDKIGRSNLLKWGMVGFTVLSISHLFISNFYLLLIVRILLGLCISIDYTVGSVLLAEWLPTGKDSIYLSKYVVYWMIGYCLSFLCGLVMDGIALDYKIIFASSLVIGLITTIARYTIGVQESPAWLSNVGRKEESKALIEKHIGSDYEIVEEASEVKEKVKVSELFSKKYRRNTLIGGTFFACQVFPFYGVSLFLPILVEQMNIGGAHASTIIYDIFTVAGAIIGVWLIKKVTRRSFLISTFYIAAISLAVMIFGQSAPMYVCIIAFSVYALMMSIASDIQFVYPPELFDDRTRGTGVGIVVASSRVGATAGTFLLPVLVESLGVYGALGICLLILIIGGIACQLYAPETAPKKEKVDA